MVLIPQILETSGNVSVNLELSAVCRSQGSTFSCERLPLEYTPYLFCSGVVSYDFYVPVGVDSSSYDLQARDLAVAANSLLPTACLTDIKKLICATIYNPCVPNVVDGDFATYQIATGVNGSAFPLPFQRPCKAVCTATTYLGSSCGGLLEAFGAATDCDVLNAYMPGYGITVYDPANDAAFCNDLASVEGIAIVAAPYEPYVGSMCSGIVEQYYVPPSSTVDPKFASLLPPFVLQSASEYGLQTLTSYIPKFMTSSCLTSQRILMCNLMFMKPFESDALLLYLGFNVYIPSYPHNDMCATYMDECSSLVSLAPALGMNCSQLIAGVPLFPTADVTVATVPLGGGLSVNLNSPPNHGNDTQSAIEFAIETQCPYAMEVPDDPSIPTVNWIEGTGCAISCPSAAYSTAEYTSLFMHNMIGDWICLGIAVVSLFNIYKTEAKKRNLFLIMEVALTGCYYGATGMFLAASYESFFGKDVNGNDIITNDMVCSSNTSIRSVDDSAAMAKSLSCQSFALIQLVIEMCSYWMCLSLSLELWTKVVLGAKDVTYHRRFYLGGGGLLTASLILMNIFYGKATIAADSALWCVWQNEDPDLVFYLKGLPYAIVYCAFACLALHLFYKCITISMGVKSSFANMWKTFKVLFLMIFILLVYYPVPIFVGFIGYGRVNYDKMVAAYVEWFVCQVTNFVSDSPEDEAALIATCGIFPSMRVSMTFQYALIFFAYMATTFLFIITLNTDVQKYYGSLFKYYKIDGITNAIYDNMIMPVYKCITKLGRCVQGVAFLQEMGGGRSHSKVSPEEDTAGLDELSPPQSDFSPAAVEMGEVVALKPSEVVNGNAGSAYAEIDDEKC